MKINSYIRRYISFIGVENEGWVRIFTVILYCYIAFAFFLLFFFYPYYIYDTINDMIHRNIIKSGNYEYADYTYKILGGILLIFGPLVVISILPRLTKLTIKLFRWIIEGFKKDNI